METNFTFGKLAETIKAKTRLFLEAPGLPAADMVIELAPSTAVVLVATGVEEFNSKFAWVRVQLLDGRIGKMVAVNLA